MSTASAKARQARFSSAAAATMLYALKNCSSNFRAAFRRNRIRRPAPANTESSLFVSQAAARLARGQNVARPDAPLSKRQPNPEEMHDESYAAPTWLPPPLAVRLHRTHSGQDHINARRCRFARDKRATFANSARLEFAQVPPRPQTPVSTANVTRIFNATPQAAAACVTRLPPARFAM